MSNIMPEPGRHNWTELLHLIKTIRWIAWHNMDDPADQMRRIRDAFGEYDGLFDEGESS